MVAGADFFGRGESGENALGGPCGWRAVFAAAEFGYFAADGTGGVSKNPCIVPDLDRSGADEMARRVRRGSWQAA